MKKYPLALIFLLVLSPLSFAQESSIDYTDYPDYIISGTPRYYSRYQGKNYLSHMPIDKLRDSSDFDIANPVLPKSLKEIIDVAYTQVEAVTKSKQN